MGTDYYSFVPSFSKCVPGSTRAPSPASGPGESHISQTTGSCGGVRGEGGSCTDEGALPSPSQLPAPGQLPTGRGAETGDKDTDWSRSTYGWALGQGRREQGRSSPEAMGLQVIGKVSLLEGAVGGWGSPKVVSACGPEGRGCDLRRGLRTRGERGCRSPVPPLSLRQAGSWEGQGDPPH